MLTVQVSGQEEQADVPAAPMVDPNLDSLELEVDEDSVDKSTGVMLANKQETEQETEAPPEIDPIVVEGVIPFPTTPDGIWNDDRLDSMPRGLFDGGRRSNFSNFTAPSNRSVIDLQDLLERAPADMLQALERETGVLMQRTQRGAASPFIRGLTGQQVLILIDGIRMNNATFRTGPNQYFNTIDPGMVDHIEVIRGPQTVLWGSDAMGGVINVVTRRTPVDALLNDPLRTWTSRYSSADGGICTRLNYQFQKGATRVFAGSGYGNFNDLDRGGDLGRQPATAYSQYSGDVRVDRLITENQAVTLSVQHFEQHDVFRTDRFPSRRTIFDPQQRSMAYVRFQGTDMGKIYDNYMLTFSMHRQREQATDARSDKSYWDDMETDNYSYGLQLLLGRELENGWNLTYGVDSYRDVVDSFRNRYDNLTNEFVSSPTPKYPDDGRFRQTGAFLQIDKELSDRLSFNGGVRFTRAHAQGTPMVDVDHDNDPATDPESQPVFISPTFDDWSAGGGLNFKLDENTALVGSVSEGFRAPNLDDLAANNDNVQQAAADTPSVDLRPERSLSYELALRKEVDDMRWQASVFWTNIDDMILRTPAGTSSESILFSRSNRDAEVNGVEVAAEKRLSTNWTAYGNFSYIYGQDLELEEPLSRIPPTQGVVGLRWRHSEKYEFVDIYSWLVDKQDRLNFQDISDGRIPDGGTPGYGTISLRYGTELKENHLLRIELENILDKAYRVHGSGVDGAGVSANIQYGFEF
jgi:hemoglobin/transferrin/lactoferrin receptor protein